MDSEKEIIIEIIKTIGFRTGSRLWNLHTADSDYDYVILWESFEKEVIKKDILINFTNPPNNNTPSFIVTDVERYNQDYFRSYKIKDGDGVVFNIIMVWQKRELEVWKRASKLIEQLPLYLVKNKKERIIIFEAYKKALRSVLKGEL